MEKILYGDELYRKENEQTYYSKQGNRPDYKQNDLIMINNHQGSYFFSSFEDERGESPVFKVKNRRSEYGQLQLRLQVMEVLYPTPLYDHETERLNIMQAIKDGLAVVKETETLITFSMNPNYRIETARLKEVDCVHDLDIDEKISGQCDCKEGCKGRVEVDSCGQSNHSHYQFFLTNRPDRGRVEVNQKTGVWVYQSKYDNVERDSFEITVWDGRGAYATQKVIIKCDKRPCPCPDPDPKPCQKVEICNTPVPVIATGIVGVRGDVRVVNSPTVRIDQPVAVTGVVGIAGTPTVVLDAPIVVTVLNVSVSVPTTVEISGTPTVLLDEPVEVTGFVGITGNPFVQLTGTPVVSISGITAVDGFLPVTGTVDLAAGAVVGLTGTVTALLDEPVEVTGFVGITGTPSICIPGIVNITGIPEITVNIATVLITVPATVTVANAITISGSPSVLIAGRGFTSILLTSFTFAPLAVLQTFETPATDVSQFRDYGYAIHLEASPTLAAILAVVPEVEVAPINDDDYFATSATGAAINIGIGGGIFNDVISAADFLRFSRAVLNVPAAVSLVGAINAEIYIQGQI